MEVDPGVAEQRDVKEQAAYVLAQHNDACRKALHFTICGEAAVSLKTLCARHGVTLTAFLDALGHSLADAAEMNPDELEALLPRVLGTIRAAQQIDALRRLR